MGLAAGLLGCLLLAAPASGASAGASLRFDGVNDYATVFPGFRLMSTWSIEAWVMPQSNQTETCMLSLHNMRLQNLLTVTSMPDGSWSVLYGPESAPIPAGAWIIGAATVDGVTFSGGDSGTYSPYPHHVTITHEAVDSETSGLQLFLNETLHATWTVPSAAAASADALPALPVLLGACHACGRAAGEGRGRATLRRSFFAGSMDEVRWWGVKLRSADVGEMYRWSGDPGRWPDAGFGGIAAGAAATSARAAALRAQHSFDVLGPQVHDGSGSGRSGLLGTRGDVLDSPVYERSAFGALLMYGSVYFALRANHRYTLNFYDYVNTLDARPLIAQCMSSNEANINWETTIFNQLKVVQSLVNASLGMSLLARGSDTVLSDGDLAGEELTQTPPYGPYVDVQTGDAVGYQSFQVQPCIPTSGCSADPCAAYHLHDVTLVVEASSPPVAGSSYALQLAREGAYVQLPQVPDTVTFEFWLQLVPPLVPGATVLSVGGLPGEGGAPGREVARLRLDPQSGHGLLDVCRGDGGAATFTVPGLAALGPQHLAVSFALGVDESGGAAYQVLVHVGCALVLSGTVQGPCATLNSSRVRRPTIGQLYVADDPGAAGGAEPRSGAFAAMYLAEVRVWSLVRPAEALCEAMTSRLSGSEAGLVAYAPVTAADAAGLAAAPAAGVLALRSARDAGLPAAAVPPLPEEEQIRVLCAADTLDCPNTARGIGFAVQLSPFDLPPEDETFLSGAADLYIDLVGGDPDNREEYALAPRMLDDWRFELLEYPSETCGRLLENDAGSASWFRIGVEGTCANCGASPQLILPPDYVTSEVDDYFPVPFDTVCPACQAAPREILPPAAVPLRLDVSMGAATPCTANLTYRAVDSQGLRSARNATVALEVWRPGVELLAVLASDSLGRGDGLSGGGILRFEFSEPTDAPQVNVHSLFEVVDGSWGSQSHEAAWTENGAVLLVRLAEGAGAAGAALEPGLARFRVLQRAGLRKLGDAHSAPCTSLSPPLAGDFGAATCSPGSVFDLPAGGCELCPAGTSWATPAEGAACAACAGGRYASQAGQTSCQPCEPGSFLAAGASNRSGCQPAPAGTYAAALGATQADPCMAGAFADEPGQSECQLCPEHASCEVPGFDKTHALADPGYFRLGNGSIGRCRVPDACLGAGACQAGAEALPPGCYRCSSGWTRGAGALRDRTSCVECPSSAAIALAMVAVWLGTLAVAVYLAGAVVATARRASCLHPFILKILLGHLLMVNSLASLEQWELEPGFGGAAPAVRLVLALCFGWDGMAPLGALPLECALESLGLGPLAQTWAAFGFWLCWPFATLLGCALATLCLLEVMSWLDASSQDLEVADEPGPQSAGPPPLGEHGCAAPEGQELDEVKSKKVRRPREGGQARDRSNLKDRKALKKARLKQLREAPDTLNAVIPISDGYVFEGQDNDLSLDPTVVPLGWEAHWSETYKRYYYSHGKTKKTTWKQPQQADAASTRASWASRGVDEPIGSRVWHVWRRSSFDLPFTERLVAHAEDSCGIAVAVVLLSYAPVLRQLMVPLRCDVLDPSSPERRLLAAPGLPCPGDGEHGGLAAAAWAALTAWGAGIPLAFLLLARHHRRARHASSSVVRTGLLCAEYEPGCYFWESVVLLRRFALVALVTLTPMTSPTFRLSALLLIGAFSAVMHHTYEPFDNRTGDLLHRLEARGLAVHCAAAAALLLGVSELAGPAAASAAVALAAAAHAAFVLGCLRHLARHLRRSIADAVVEEYMQFRAGLGAREDPRKLGGWLRNLRQRIFLAEASSQQRQSQVRLRHSTGAIELSGSGQDELPRDQEQLLLARGLADCVVQAVTTCKVELLSMHLAEYLGRQAFAESASRLGAADQVRRALLEELGRGGGGEAPEAGEVRGERPRGSQHLRDSLAERRTALFVPSTFERSMSASDFHGALSTISKYSWDHLHNTFHTFMVEKDGAEEYRLAPLERVIGRMLAHNASVHGEVVEVDAPGLKLLDPGPQSPVRRRDKRTLTADDTARAPSGTRRAPTIHEVAAAGALAARLAAQAAEGAAQQPVPAEPEAQSPLEAAERKMSLTLAAPEEEAEGALELQLPGSVQELKELKGMKLKELKELKELQEMGFKKKSGAQEGFQAQEEAMEIEDLEQEAKAKEVKNFKKDKLKEAKPTEVQDIEKGMLKELHVAKLEEAKPREVQDLKKGKLKELKEAKLEEIAAATTIQALLRGRWSRQQPKSWAPRDA